MRLWCGVDGDCRGVSGMTTGGGVEEHPPVSLDLLRAVAGGGRSDTGKNLGSSPSFVLHVHPCVTDGRR